uniref:Uncharacterized protein n=1 Tax=Rhizophora mucronata TaxID=61149 RepID=A0A2P2Q0V1_RHIMU
MLSIKVSKLALFFCFLSLLESFYDNQVYRKTKLEENQCKSCRNV